MPRRFQLSADAHLEPQRVCKRCGESHPISFYNKDSYKPDGLYPYCKNCSRAATRAVIAKYRARYNAQKAKWKRDNRPKNRQMNRAYQKENTRRFSAHASNHRARKIGAMPPWVDVQQMVFIYEMCPTGHHVDHIYPLHHKEFCGLHVPANLQFLPAIENFKKNNRAPAEYYERRADKSVPLFS